MAQAKVKKLAVIGGGAAGFFAAINAKTFAPHLAVEILEATPRVLAKVKVSGGGRCNVTHHCFAPKDLVESYPRGRKELLGPFHRFQPADTVAWFESRGLQLKAEADGRMFPVTNQSSSVIDLFIKETETLGITVRCKTLVVGARPALNDNDGFELELKGGSIETFDYLVLATGSAPYGTALVQQLGHRLIDPVPSLFTFEVDDALFTGMPGTSFVNTTVDLKVAGKSFRQSGPLLFTHWGLSGTGGFKAICICSTFSPW